MSFVDRRVCLSCTYLLHITRANKIGGLVSSEQRTSYHISGTANSSYGTSIAFRQAYWDQMASHDQ